MNVPSRIIVSCATAAVLASTAFAHDQPSSSQTGGSAQQPPGGQQSGALQKAQTQEFFRASKITGKSAQTPQGQKIGDIKDIVFNQQGEIFALVNVGSGRLAVLPWQAIDASSAKGGKNVVINTSEQALKSGPVVAEDQWGALNNPQFAQGVYSYYHIQSPTAMGGAETPSGMSQGQGASSQEKPSDQGAQQKSQEQQQGSQR